MNVVKVDSSGRLHLESLNPGDFYLPEFVSPDRITLRRVTAASRVKTQDEVVEAIEKSPLRFSVS